MTPRCAGAMLLLAAFAGAQAVPPRRSSAGDLAQQRAAWFLRFRQSRDGQPPAADLLQAWRQARRMPVIRPLLRRQLQANGPAAVGGNWTELGPHPETDPYYGAVAGRMTAIAVDTGKDPSGNTVYLGAADGGVWMSTNALSANPTFTPIGDNLPSLAIGAIALDDSTTPTTIYVGTGEANGSGDSYYGLGIYKSTDGGATWTAGTGVNFFGSAIGKLLVDPDSPNIVLAAVTEGGVNANNDLLISTPAIGIARSTDGGATWSQVYSNASATDLIYDAGTFYAAIRARGIVKSTTQGATWQPLPSVFGNASITVRNFYRASLAIRGGLLFALIADAGGTPTQPSDCAGAATCAGLVESADGGVIWSALALPANLYGSNNQGDYDQFLAAPANSSLLLVGGIDVWKEDLAKPGWANLTNAYTTGTVHPDEHTIAVLSPQAWIIANDGGAWSTANAGTNWTDMNASIGAIQFYSVTPDPATAGRLLGGSQDNGTVLAAPGNLDWPEVFGGDGGHTAINPQKPQQLFTENYNVSVQCSNDGGGSFNPVVDATLVTDPAEFYVPYLLAPADPGTMLLAASRVWRGPACPATVDTGWQAISPTLTHPDVSPDLSPTTDYLTAIAAAPSSPDVIYTGAFDGSLSVTTNATVSGAQPTWTEAPAGTPLTFQGPISAIAVDPTNPGTVYWGMGYVGGQATLYKSTDGGKTAVNIAGNLPGTPINAIVVDPGNPDDIFVATDVGVFATGDGGAKGSQEIWAREGDNLPAAAVLSLALTGAGGTPTLVAGTHGRGAWSMPAAVPPTFTLSLTPSSVSVIAEQPAAFTVQTAALGGASTIALSCSPQCSVSPASIAAGGTATVTATPTTGGTYLITVTGDNGFAKVSQSAAVQASDFAFSLANAPHTFQLGQSMVYNWTLAPFALQPPIPPFNAPVTLACPKPPAGITCAFSPASVASVTGVVTGTLTVAAADIAAPGSVNLEVDATSGNLLQGQMASFTLTQFELTSTPASRTAMAGTSAVFQVSASSASNYSGSIALSCAPGSSLGACSFQPPAITAGQASTLTISGFPASYSSDFFNVTGTTAGSSVSAPVSVQAEGFYFNGSPPPTIPGASGLASTLTLTTTHSFPTPIALSCAGPAGVQCAFSPASVSSGQSATLTVSGMAGLPESTAIPLTITGAGGGVQASTILNVANDGDFQIHENSGSNVILPGDPATFDVNGFSLNGLQAPVNFTCGAPPVGAACNVGSNGKITVTGLSGSGAVTVPIIGTASQGGATLSHTLDASVTLGDFSISPVKSAVTMLPSQPGYVFFTIQGTSYLTTTLQLSCSGLPAGVTCTGGPTPVFLPGPGTGGITMNLWLSPTAGATAPSSGDWWTGGWIFLLAGCLVLAWKKRPRLALVGTLALAMIACGGGAASGGSGLGSGSGSGSGAGNSAPITATVTVVATDVTPGVIDPVSRSTTFQLTIN